MSKTINPYWKARLFWLFMIIMAILAFWVSGCNSAKIAARKNQQAIDRVLTNPQLLQTAYSHGAELWPCANDTSFIFKEGKTDTVPFPVIIDTTDRRRIKDSLMAGLIQPMQDECNEKIKKAFDLGVQITAKELSKIKIPIRQPDTLAGYIVDRRMATTLLDTINKRNTEVAYWRGKADEWQKATDDKQAERIRLFWLLLAVIALFVGSNVAWVLYKTRKP